MRRLLFWFLLIAPGVFFGLAILTAHHGADHYVCGGVDQYGCKVGDWRHVTVPFSHTWKLAMFGVMAAVYLIIYAIVWTVRWEDACTHDEALR